MPLEFASARRDMVQLINGAKVRLLLGLLHTKRAISASVKCGSSTVAWRLRQSTAGGYTEG